MLIGGAHDLMVADRHQVQACFERRFIARRMAAEYVALYEDLVRGHAYS